MRKLIFCLLLAASGLFAATNAGRPALHREYNPFLAGTLSWYSAGLGQIYTGDYLKGAVFFALDNTLLYMAINAIADINFVINGDIGLGVNVALRRDLDNKRFRLNGTFFLIAFVTFHFYNVFDAVLTSTRKNRIIIQPQSDLDLGDDRQDPVGMIEMPLFRQRF